jgi:hypothetical protein
MPALGLVLNFVPNPAQAVTEMKRVLRAGGTSAAYVWDHAGRSIQPLRRALIFNDFSSDQMLPKQPIATGLGQKERVALGCPCPRSSDF